MAPTAADELTAIDGVDRSDAEVIFESEPGAEDWTAQDEAAGADALEAVVAEMVERRLVSEREQILGEATSAAMAAMAQQMAQASDKPALSMKAKVHEGFITESNAPKGQTAQPWIKHFRCESAVSTKLTEIDMDLLDKYMNGDLERPSDPKTGRPYSDGRIINLCEIPGQYITWVEGHCYCFTPNQVRNIDRVQELDRLGQQGGMAGIYEDHGGVSWQCQVCPTRPTFMDERTWRGHMVAVHAVAPATLG